MRYPCTSLRMAKILNADITKCWQGDGAETPIHFGWECTEKPGFGREFVSYKTELAIQSSHHTPWYFPTGAASTVHTACTLILMAVLGITAKRWKEVGCPSEAERHTVEPPEMT
jgi:hypothetical protein